MSDEINDFLEHYGVKGMKWGVRKDQQSSSETNKPNRSEINQKVKAGKAHVNKSKKKTKRRELDNVEKAYLVFEGLSFIAMGFFALAAYELGK